MIGIRRVSTGTVWSHLDTVAFFGSLATAGVRLVFDALCPKLFDGATTDTGLWPEASCLFNLG